MTTPFSPRRPGVLLALMFFASGAAAEVPADYLRSIEASARAGAASFAGFSAARGEAWFHTRHGDWSCATCHTANPLAEGRHAITGRKIAPLAPAANPERLTDAAKIEKWFRRNCNDVLGRACTPIEKGDVLAYLIALKR
jgi:mono/diheme cytochrome c family protein